MQHERNCLLLLGVLVQFLPVLHAQLLLLLCHMTYDLVTMLLHYWNDVLLHWSLDHYCCHHHVNGVNQMKQQEEGEHDQQHQHDANTNDVDDCERYSVQGRQTVNAQQVIMYKLRFFSGVLKISNLGFCCTAFSWVWG